MKHALAYLITARAFAAASLVAATYATAMAQSGSAPQILPRAVTLVGTVSVRELSASAANPQTPQMQQNPAPLEVPLPGSVQTSPPSQEMLERLPLATETNAGVGRHIPFRQISGFTGITLGSEAAVGGNGTPPTQGLAVHDNIVAEIVNRAVQFFKSDGTPLTNPIRVSIFFLAEDFDLVAPQVFFDPKSERWYLLDNIFPPGVFTGGIALAVSQTSDPLGMYFVYHIRLISDDLPGCGGRDCWPGYPHGGYDANAFFISTRLSTCFPGCLVAQAVYVLPKAQLEAGPEAGESLNVARFVLDGDSFVQPSVPAPHEPFETANGGTEYLMRATSSNFVSVVAISNTSEINRSPGSLRISNVDVPTEPYEKMVVPSAQPNIVGPTCASLGVTSAPSLDARFSEFQATIQKAGGNLYGVLPFGSNDGNGFSRDVLAWYTLRPRLTSTRSLTANIVAQGYVVPPDGYSLIHPAIAVNKAGRGLIGFTVSNPDANAPGGFPSAAFIEFAGFPTAGTSLLAAKVRLRTTNGLPACVPVRGESLRGAIMARQPWMRPPASSTSAMSTFRIRPYFPALRTAIGGPSSLRWPRRGGRWAHRARARTNLVTDVADCRRVDADRFSSFLRICWSWPNSIHTPWLTC